MRNTNKDAKLNPSKGTRHALDDKYQDDNFTAVVFSPFGSKIYRFCTKKVLTQTDTNIQFMECTIYIDMQTGKQQAYGGIFRVNLTPNRHI